MVVILWLILNCFGTPQKFIFKNFDWLITKTLINWLNSCFGPRVSAVPLGFRSQRAERRAARRARKEEEEEKKKKPGKESENVEASEGRGGRRRSSGRWARRREHLKELRKTMIQTVKWMEHTQVFFFSFFVACFWGGLVWWKPKENHERKGSFKKKDL